MNIEKFEKVETWLSLNAKLQQKKNQLRKALKEKGVLQKGGKNDFDHYKYFSEAQYKELFTELFSANNLELKFDEIDYETFQGSQKMPNGRVVKLEFMLTDCETGFYETTTISGEALDKGDKGGYKAYTGALKYYLANTFMVATGDEVESESPNETMNDKSVSKITPNQMALIMKVYKDENLTKLLQHNNIEKLEDMTKEKASELIRKLRN